MTTRRAAGPASASGAPAAVTVIVGEEDLLVERAVAALKAAALRGDADLGVHGSQSGDGDGQPGDRDGREPGDAGAPARAGRGGGLQPSGAGPQPAGDGGTQPGGDVHEAAAADLAPGELASLTSPSLFGGACVVIIRDAQDAGKEVADELARYAASPAPDVVLIVTHAGGQKGKALLTALAGGNAQFIECPKVVRVADRMDFARAEFRRAGRSIDEAGLRALLDAVGSGLREIAAACDQLATDVAGPIDQAVVARYYRGRAEASGFSVADCAVEGRLGEALEQLRWALASGVPPVLISSALAQGVRLLGRVGSASRKPSTALAPEVGAPPWKVDRVKRQLRDWAPAGVSAALRAVAEADAQVKGEGTSPAYALERAVRHITACRVPRSGTRSW